MSIAIAQEALLTKFLSRLLVSAAYLPVMPSCDSGERWTPMVGEWPQTGLACAAVRQINADCQATDADYMLALSIVAPQGTNIALGRKTLEVRSWKPEHLPLRNLLIVENDTFLLEEGQFDPKGTAVALVDVEEVHEWQPTELQAACSNSWSPGYWAWSLSNVRPMSGAIQVAAHRKLYEVQVAKELLPPVD